jgi:uncharacterized RDD family membrane protein YckC
MEPTYKIIGGDGREYGPASLEELKSWIRDGRAGARTLVWRSDLEAWEPASTMEELRPDLPQPTASTPTGAEVLPAQSLMIPVGFGPRVGAYFVDWLLMNLLGMLLPANEALLALSKGETITPEQVPSVLVHLAIGLFITAVYNVGLNGLIGATVGKLLIGAHVVRADGARLGYRRAALRFASEITSWLTLGIGFLFVAFRADRRGLHDLLAGTRVVWHRPDLSQG